MSPDMDRVRLASQRSRYLGLMPWEDVAAVYSAHHPRDPLTYRQVREVGSEAERKLREWLADLYREWYGEEAA